MPEATDATLLPPQYVSPRKESARRLFTRPISRLDGLESAQSWGSREFSPRMSQDKPSDRARNHEFKDLDNSGR
jgi:hypothetical protein